ncbi:MAG: S1C family serine protease [Pirellulaceae bacterium]
MAVGTVRWIAAIGLGVAIGWVLSSLPWLSQSNAQDRFQGNPYGIAHSTPPQDLWTPEERINIEVYDRCNTGVVYIATKSISRDSFLTLSAVAGSGSGSVLDHQGHILTNYHVIEDARDIQVTLAHGESYPAERVGQDPDNDIAVLKINAPVELLHPIPLGDSSQLRVGQRILAIGNPFGLERTLSDGIISSLNRQLPSRSNRTMRSIIQINAALNQGNSGGPLLNSQGELIGMNTAIATSTGDSAGIGFSIPSNTIRRVVPQLISSGRVIRPTIGITRIYETKEALGLLVVKVTPGGPADQAGIRGFQMKKSSGRRAGILFEQEVVDPSSADLIIGIDGQRITKVDDLLALIESRKAGDQLQVSIIREGRQMTVPIVLGASE